MPLAQVLIVFLEAWVNGDLTVDEILVRNEKRRKKQKENE